MNVVGSLPGDQSSPFLLTARGSGCGPLSLAVAAPAGAGAAAAPPLLPPPAAACDLPVDDAIQSLLGLAEASSGEVAPAGSDWDGWQTSGGSGAGSGEAVLLRRLTPADMQQGQLRFPAALFERLFGRPSSGRVVIQAATTSVGHFLEAQAVQCGTAYLLQGDAVHQLYRDLNAELADVLRFHYKGCMPEGAPIALCCLAEKAGAAAAAAAAAVRGVGGVCSSDAAAPAWCSGASPAGSPASPEQQQLLPLRGGSPSTAAAAATGAHRGAAAWGPGGGSEGAADIGGEPAAPHTINNYDALAAVAAAGSRDGASSDGLAGCFGPAEVLAAAAGAEEDCGTAAAAAAVTPAAPAAGAAAAVDDEGRDPDWQAKPRGRGRPRKRRPAGAPAAAAGCAGRQAAEAVAAAALTCAHCGTCDTPRWWKDNFPMGTLCNACGIWLKRHGYPRPVQFFLNPLSASAATTGSIKVAAAAAAQQQRQQQQQAAQQHAQQQQQQSQAQQQQQQQQAGSSREAPTDVEYYLINGRPKRRRTAAGSGGGGAPSSSTAPMVAHPNPQSMGSGDTEACGSDPPINFEAAGRRVFVVRRKMIKAEGSADTVAALVHFGWAPAARAAHEMYGAVARYGEASRQVAVDDYELLSDCKATATLQLRPDAAAAAVPSWDALVRDFVDSL